MNILIKKEAPSAACPGGLITINSGSDVISMCILPSSNPSPYPTPTPTPKPVLQSNNDDADYGNLAAASNRHSSSWRHDNDNWHGGRRFWRDNRWNSWDNNRNAWSSWDNHRRSWGSINNNWGRPNRNQWNDKKTHWEWIN